MLRLVEPPEPEFVRENVTVHEKASFDCRKAATPVERAICAEPRSRGGRPPALERVQDDAGPRRPTAASGWRRPSAPGSRAATATARRSRSRRGCLLRAYGRRLLELRAWPEAPFGPDDRPDVAVLTRVLVTKGEDAIARTGLAELAAGLVGGIPAEMDLEPRTDEPAGLAFSGCD